MNIKTIKTIFTNTLFVIGVIVTIIGFVNSTRTIANIVVFEKYPLGYEETRCQDMAMVPKIEIQQEQNEQQYQNCVAQLENTRKQRQVTDITTSFSTLISGLAVALIFRKFIFS
jgi:hypothetical protein